MAEDDHAAIGQRVKKIVRIEWRFGRTTNTPDMHLHVGRQLVDHVSFQESPGTDAEGSDSGSLEVGFGTEAGKLVDL